jgi:hypothetical protein
MLARCVFLIFLHVIAGVNALFKSLKLPPKVANLFLVMV